jgi:bifunctional DNA-binding transcriptional regulator/antitoxin component of YhaV-PrlF toxin-antitoxin module
MRNPRGSKKNLLHQTAKPSIQSRIPERSGPSPAGRSRTTAHGVVASLALPAARPAASQPVSPLPLTSFHQLPRDASMLYDIGLVDGSGRVASNGIIDALGWRPGSKLDIILTPRTIVIRAAPDGLFSVPRRPCIIIPSHVRQPHGIKPGDHVLIASAPDYGLVIVYPLSALDEMISRYHSAKCEAERLIQGIGIDP